MTSLTTQVAFFLVVTFLTSLVVMCIRLRDPKHIARDTTRLFLQVTIGIGIFCAIVVALEHLFVRPIA